MEEGDPGDVLSGGERRMQGEEEEAAEETEAHED